MKKLSTIVANYGTKTLIEKFVTNLLSAYDNQEIIFVDNDSPDGSADLAQALFSNNSKFKLIREKTNVGIASAYNSALKVAEGDYILYLGTDAFPTKEALISIMEYMDAHPDVGIVTPKLVLRDGSIDMDAHRGFQTPWVAITHLAYLDRIFPKSKVFNGYSMQYLDLNTRHEIDVCISHFMFVNPKVHEQIGKWDEDYFVYGEDIDICYRTKEAGFKIMYLGDVEVLHYKGASVNRSSAKDIDNVLNKDVSTLTIKNEIVDTKKVSSTSFWMRVRLARESSWAMKLFYKKHLASKYPKIITGMILAGIWINEQMKVAKVYLNKYLKSK